MAKSAPTECPKCRAAYAMRPIGERQGGFSGGKAVVGAIIAGPIGVAAGALGKKKQHISVQNVATQWKFK